ncbi:hypothetical protein [Qaidamihabitans albus]|nr:hypothetical protein [Qaidamihabitans albus]
MIVSFLPYVIWLALVACLLAAMPLVGLLALAGGAVVVART